MKNYIKKFKAYPIPYMTGAFGGMALGSETVRIFGYHDLNLTNILLILVILLCSYIYLVLEIVEEVLNERD